jgi:hypothetical protein
MDDQDRAGIAQGLQDKPTHVITDPASIQQARASRCCIPDMLGNRPAVLI